MDRVNAAICILAPSLLCYLLFSFRNHYELIPVIIIMKMILSFCLSAFSLFIALPTQLIAQSPYSFKRADPDGTGKWYMGREIAHVMSHYAIGWLERDEREQEERTSLLLKNMQLKSGEIVADIGAGSGYHVVRMAPLVGPAGRVKAIDIQQEMLDFIGERTRKSGIVNVDLVKGTEQSLQLPLSSVDKMLLVDVYHEFSFPKEMGLSMFSALKPGGRVYLIEFRSEDPDVPIKRVHKMTEKQAQIELEAVGFLFEKNLDNLPWQHCLIFRKPGF
jgi:ubiquinone/menaquinone biosynthesis C-methylase UbiE